MPIVAASWLNTAFDSRSDEKYNPKRLVSSKRMGEIEKVVKKAVEDDMISGSLLRISLNESAHSLQNLFIHAI